MQDVDDLIARWRSGEELDQLLTGASTSYMCMFGLAFDLDRLLPAPYDTPGRAWTRLDETQRATVRRLRPVGADYAEALAHDALREGFANYGLPLPPEQIIPE